MKSGTAEQQNESRRRKTGWRDETERKTAKAQGETPRGRSSGCEPAAHTGDRGAAGARLHSHQPLPTSVSSGSAWGLRVVTAGTSGWELRRGTHTDVCLY